MRADERTRTADLLITSELLYLLSYVGLLRRVSISQGDKGVIYTMGSPCLHRGSREELYLVTIRILDESDLVVVPIDGEHLGY